MIQQGFVLMVTGMAMVFIFLFAMVFAMNGLAGVVRFIEAARIRKHKTLTPKQDLSREAAALAVASQFIKKG